MSREISADDARCQIMQAQAILSMLLESLTANDGRLSDITGAVMTLLEGVPEVMEALFIEYTALQIAAMRGRK